MTDPYLDAMREYERTVAPAYELIRRARHRLRDRVGSMASDVEDLPLATEWASQASPDEPDGAALALEAALDQPGEVPTDVAHGTGASETPPLPASARGLGTPRPVSKKGAARASGAAGRSARSEAHGTSRPPGRRPNTPSPASASASASSPPGGRLDGSEGPTPPATGQAQSGPYPCPEAGCDRVFNAPTAVGVHRRHAHGHRAASGTAERWVCARCPAWFTTREARDTHQATHPEPPVGKPVHTRAYVSEVDKVLHR